MIEVTENYVKQQIENLQKQIDDLKDKKRSVDNIFNLSYLEPKLSAFQSVYDFIQGQKEARK